MDQARSAEREAAAAATAAGPRAVTAEARAVALREGHDALLQRITPETRWKASAKGRRMAKTKKAAGGLSRQA